MTLLINPGSGPVAGATREHAYSNIEAFIKDVGIVDVMYAYDATVALDDGRWRFLLARAGVTCDVDMPGLPLDHVRYMNEPGQNAWHFPRLYVDGNSWLWEFAIGQARDALTATRGDR